jgi:hypothetical protein
MQHRLKQLSDDVKGLTGCPPYLSLIGQVLTIQTNEPEQVAAFMKAHPDRYKSLQLKKIIVQGDGMPAYVEPIAPENWWIAQDHLEGKPKKKGKRWK